jgi:predicted lipoprotein
MKKILTIIALIVMFACQEAKKNDSKTTQTEQVEKFTPETFSETDIPENIKKQEKAVFCSFL